jgi:hypothetical protein
MLKTNLHMMNGKVANKATTSGEEQISVVIRQMREGIKSKAINCHKYRSREMGSLIELHPVGVVVIGHGILNYFQAFHPCFYMTGSVKDVSLLELQDNRTNGERRMNVGLMKTMGEGVERPGIGSNHTPIICSLHNPAQNDIHTNRVKRLTETNIDGSCRG